MTKFRDEFLRLPLVRRRLDIEADGGHWWAVSSREAGAVAMPLRSNSIANRWPPLSDQVMFVCDMAEALNKHIGHDGKWIVQLIHPRINPAIPVMALANDNLVETEYGEFRFHWLDADGDPQFTVECDEPVYKWYLEGWQGWVASAEAAHMEWTEKMRRVLEPERQGATFKKAQGEKAPSAT